ncbi:hypothetical protein J6590_099129, partial [Homalodisca vitripennis]
CHRLNPWDLELCSSEGFKQIGDEEAQQNESSLHLFGVRAPEDVSREDVCSNELICAAPARTCHSPQRSSRSTAGAQLLHLTSFPDTSNCVSCHPLFSINVIDQRDGGSNFLFSCNFFSPSVHPNVVDTYLETLLGKIELKKYSFVMRNVNLRAIAGMSLPSSFGKSFISGIE